MSGRKPYTGPTKLVLGFDIGTTYSGVSYSILEQGRPPQIGDIDRFPGQPEGILKVPSILCYDTHGDIKLVGSEALVTHVNDTAAQEGWSAAKGWKLHFRPPQMTCTTAKQNESIPPLPPGKTAIDILADFIRFLFRCAKNYILERHPRVQWMSIEDSIEFVFTHPNGWEGPQRQQYRQAIERAGLVPGTSAGKTRIRMITECEACLHYFVSNVLARYSDKKPGHVVVIDAGGGTIDVSMYSVTWDPVSCREIAPAQCRLQGSIFKGTSIDEAFLGGKGSKDDDSVHSRVISWMDSFSSHNAFDVVKEVFQQQQTVAQVKIDMAFITGGFSQDDSLHKRLRSYFESRNIELCWSANDAAVANGAVCSHIYRHPKQPLITSRVPRAMAFPKGPALSSAARDRWEHQKRAESVQNVVIDKIMGLIGLEHVKEQILNIKAIVDAAKSQGISTKKECLNLCLVGNPGTGKTTVARLYAEFLKSIGALSGDAFRETTGSKLCFEGVQGAKTLIDDVLKIEGGTVFIDEAYQLVSDNSGRQVLDFLLDEMESKMGTIVFIFAGYSNPMEKFMEYNPSLSARFPYQLRFADYTHAQLMLMLEDLLDKRYNGWMEVEGGIDGLYARIAVRRLVRGSGQQGFGNVRALENMLLKVRERQAERLEREQASRMQVDHFLLTKENLIGPDPSKVIPESAAWKKLQVLIGLESVKDAVRSMFKLLETNYQRELVEKEPITVSLNRVFIGPPGTGKTSVAKLYGQILTDLGMLSKGEVVIKSPADFVGDHLGGSESNTKAILESTRGKVLVIDEAYMLYCKDKTNPYSTSVIDTMVAEIQSVPGEDRCVLLLGYKDQMEEMFRNVNPGLSRRFAIENAFHFEDFTEPQLMQIFELKLKDQDLHASDEAKRVAGEVLNRMRVRPYFGNAGEVDNLLGQAKNRYQKRISSTAVSQAVDVTFEPEDFDPDYARSRLASDNLERLFADIVGHKELKETLGNYQRVALRMRQKGMSIEKMREVIPTSFVFKGPPGTGKTTIARKVGRIYYDMGFLASAEVVECSASDLIGQYVGHTGPKTQGMFERALGKVLFIDEAYRLSSGQYAKEATEELVGLMTNARFMNKLIVILAGYEKEMNTLLETNPGLSSRFSKEIIFRNLTSTDCLELLDQKLRNDELIVPELTERNSMSYFKMKCILDQMAMLPSWGNARDVKTLGQEMVLQAYTNMSDHEEFSLSVEAACRIMEEKLKAQLARLGTPRALHTSTTQVENTDDSTLPQYSPPRLLSPPPQFVAEERGLEVLGHNLLTSCIGRLAPPQIIPTRGEPSHDARTCTPASTLTEDESLRLDDAQRESDASVSDAVLQATKHQQETEVRAREEMEIQKRLRSIGRCPMDYAWIREEDGYKCAGGTHFMSLGELARVVKDDVHSL